MSNLAVNLIKTKGDETQMAYETKALLMAIYSIAKNAKSVDEVCKQIKKIANVEGVILSDDDEQAKESSF